MNRYSDSESHDSDDGIRYKTVSTRFKSEENLSIRSGRSRSRSPQKRDVLGPQLPPDLRKDSDSDKTSSTGPELPPRLSKKDDHSENSTNRSQLPCHVATKEAYIGPQLPPHLQKKREAEDSSSYGPQLPPHLTETPEPSRIGPYLPPHLRQKLQNQAPPSEEPEDSEDEIYGPLPATASITSRAQLALEERALQLKMDQLEPNTDKAKAREEWMLELPEVKASRLGLGPRQFRAKAGPDMSDRSSWTDTPDTKHKKKDVQVDLKKETELREIRKRDEEQDKISKKLKKKNKESLLEMHQVKMKAQKKDEGPSERRPFSRDTDLQVNRFDEAQKKAVLKKAQLLDDRFSSGQSKFL